MAGSCCSPSMDAPDTSSVMARPAVACPTNHQVGKTVETLTLKALLSVPLTQIAQQAYRFCPDPHCPTVYYSSDGKQLFTESHLRERVYQKHPDDAGELVCYCFQHTSDSIRHEIMQSGSSRVIEQITAGIQAGHCACDIRNPQGDCCLGNVRQVVKRIQVELQDQANAS